MHASITSILLGALLAPATAPATRPATAPTTMGSTTMSSDATVDPLLARLGADEAAVRDKAQRELLALPDAVLLPRLQAARREARDPDLQLRLDTLLVQVQERADVGGSRVTLRFDDAPLDQVLKSLAAQAQADFGELGPEFANFNGIGNGTQGMPRVTLDLQNVSLWRAIDEIQDQAKVVFAPQPDGWRVTRNFGQPSMVSGSESGAFLVQPTMASYQRNISYARHNVAGGEYFSLQFQVLAEPKIRLAASQGTLNLERAVDSNGNDLLGGNGGRAQQFSSGQGQSAISCALQLKYPKNAGEQIAEISGTMRISMARRLETLSSDDVTGPTKMTMQIDGTRITVEPYPANKEADDKAAPNDGGPQRVNPNGGPAAPVDLMITIVNARGGDGSIGARLAQSMSQQLRVTDARGASMRLTNFSTSRSDGQRTEMRAMYTPSQPQNSQGPYRAKLEIPTSYREVDVPFTMGNLKMP